MVRHVSTTLRSSPNLFLGGILMNNYYPNYNQFYGQMQMPKMANAQPMQSVQPMQTMEQ